MLLRQVVTKEMCHVVFAHTKQVKGQQVKGMMRDCKFNLLQTAPPGV